MQWKISYTFWLLKNIDDAIGIRTRDRMMVDVEESTELCLFVSPNSQRQ